MRCLAGADGALAIFDGKEAVRGDERENRSEVKEVELSE